jgi:hypothetical protein
MARGNGTMAPLKFWRDSADKPVMRERRSETRMLCADMLEITWKKGAGKAHRETALLEDISHSGACLQLEQPVPLGAQLRWESPRQVFTGRVMYCVYREIGYFVGVEFDPVSKWSRSAYRPQHLLDLQRLAETAKR